MKRHASVIWQGSVQEGRGRISTQTGTLHEAPYSFGARFTENGGKGTNPEELIAAAHAACFSMALSSELGKAGIKPEEIDTKATLTMDQHDGRWSIDEVHLDVTAKLPNADRQAFETAATKAKEGCPVSRVLNAKVTVDAHLASYTESR